MARRRGGGGRGADRTLLKPGDQVQAKWAGVWWPAEVVAVGSRGRVTVHYAGWEDDWDEEVPASRLRRGGPATPPPAIPPLPSGNPPPGPVWTDPLDRLLHGRPVTADTQLGPGDDVLAEWYGVWWRAEVLAVQGDGRVLVRYAGWGDAWDEAVPRERLAREAPGSGAVTVHFDAGWSLTGRLVESRPDVLVLEGPGGRRLFVNRQRVAFWEVEEEDGLGGG